MATDDHRMLVPVELLREGIYVCDLDRPWTETPFLFQGFSLEADGDIQTLREHCDNVVVDPERCDPQALADLRAALLSLSVNRPAGASAEGDAVAAVIRPRPRNFAAIFGDRRNPDPAGFRALVAKAHRTRMDARRVVDNAMRDLRLGRSVDTRGTRALIHDLVDTVSGDASAALWLTNLKNADEYTSIHCVNVCILSLAFGVHVGLDRNQLLQLGIGSMLHDVGKTLTPKGILNKAGRLTPEEFEVMKRHAEDGYRIMADNDRMPKAALEIIRYHHERRAGQGYPLGLSGDRIPLHALIVGIADMYDAMTSDRVYRAGLPADQVLSMLYEQADDLFGVELVREFIRCVGIYPVGSVVELDNGAVGVVVAIRPDARLQPTILLLRNPDGKACARRALINLAAPVRGDNAPRRIRRALEPASAGVNPAAIVGREFGLQV